MIATAGTPSASSPRTSLNPSTTIRPHAAIVSRSSGRGAPSRTSCSSYRAVSRATPAPMPSCAEANSRESSDGKNAVRSHRGSCVVITAMTPEGSAYARCELRGETGALAPVPTQHSGAVQLAGHRALVPGIGVRAPAPEPACVRASPTLLVRRPRMAPAAAPCLGTSQGRALCRLSDRNRGSVDKDGPPVRSVSIQPPESVAESTMCGNGRLERSGCMEPRGRWG